MQIYQCCEMQEKSNYLALELIACAQKRKLILFVEALFERKCINMGKSIFVPIYIQVFYIKLNWLCKLIID
jgi:hypothetical protein